MLFHVGAVRRLFEADALRDLARITSVSGGSIANAMLGIHWDAIAGAAGDVAVWKARIEDPIFEFAGRRLDARAVISGLVRPRRGASGEVADAYDDLLDGATLQRLPETPRFVILATNLGTGSLLRFASPYSADYRVGKRDGLDTMPASDSAWEVKPM